MACSEEADLPCTVHTDPQGPYRVFWAKVSAAMPAGEGSAGFVGGRGGPPPWGLCVAPSRTASNSGLFPHASLNQSPPHLGTRRLD